MSRYHNTRLALAVILPVSLACSILSEWQQGAPRADAGRAIAAVALQLDGDRSKLSGFVGQSSDTWALLPGTYLVAAVDEEGTSLVIPSMVAAGGPLPWPADFGAAGGTQDPQRRVVIEIVLNFLMLAEAAELGALENLSAGFTQPLFTTQPGQTELDALLADYDDIAAQQFAVVAAVDSLSLLVPNAGAGGRLASPATDWKETLFGFFGFAGNAGARAGERIKTIAELMSPEDKAEAFEAVRDELKSDAQNFDELLERLGSGALNPQAAQIESDMRNAAGFIAAAQEANLTTAQVVHKEGGELVSKGAELEAWVVKTVLDRAFPGLASGWDAAEKTIKWTGYAQTAYGKGILEGIQALTVDQAKDKLKENLLGALASCCPDLNDAIVEEITDELADKIAGEIVGLHKGAIPDASGAAPGTGGSANGGFAAVLELSSVSIASKSCTPHPNSVSGYDCRFDLVYHVAYDAGPGAEIQCFSGSSFESNRLNVSGEGSAEIPLSLQTLYYSPGTLVSAFCQMYSTSGDWLASGYLGTWEYEESFYLDVP